MRPLKYRARLIIHSIENQSVHFLFSGVFLPFTYECDQYKRCIRQDVINAGSESLLSMGECKLTCGDDSVLWPRPREADLGKTVAAFHPEDIEFTNEDDFKVR
jgi:hypothetical protein